MIKRCLDFIIALLLLVIFSPVLLIITILLIFANQGKPFFLQKRPGKNEVIFTIIKFKTMNDKKDAEGNLLPDEDRLTIIGKVVRLTSLDELPQLFNVLKGDMSFVGPRPLLVSYLPRYNSFQRKRHKVKPGITGWAQVNGRNAVSWDQRYEHDIWYVENHSLWLDLKIMWLTFIKVLTRDGATAEGGATMEEFKGNFQ